MKELKMPRKAAGVILALLAAVVLAACSSSTIPEGFDKEEITESAKEIVQLLSEKDYDSVIEKFSPVMAELTADKLDEAISKKLDEAGELKEMTLKSMTGGSTKETGDFVTAIMICEYEIDVVSFNISFDRDGKICGLYMV